MKKLNILFLLVLLCAISKNCIAQEKGQWNASLSYAFGGEVAANGGINLGVEYSILESISIAPNVNYYFIDVANIDFMDKANYWDWNLDARWYVSNKKTKIYGLIGYTQYRIQLKDSRLDEIKIIHNGINVGLGAYFPLGERISINPQFKYNSHYDGNFILNAGFVYRLK